ncbi:uncharacterized protein LOC129797941 [Phlebotomus papatasi]|uniref:uncharacterized protein LOC129797941 n=1 Tax=Phlebotomus papatasi TaxID=29031 RepID=UPI00248353C9|nr:uncharacterized protein LOC129797941 [Phlebotomus papatasi]
MNTKSLLICIALLVTFSLATAQRNENMFSPAGCPPNSRPVENAPKNQASCGDTQQAQEENQVEAEGDQGDQDPCEGEECVQCVCFEGYLWNGDRTRCVEPSECE